MRTAIAHFDYSHRPAIPGHYVDLEAPEEKITSQHDHPPGLEVADDQGFYILTEVATVFRMHKTASGCPTMRFRCFCSADERTGKSG